MQMKIRDFLGACADTDNLNLTVKLPDGTEYFDGTPGELSDDLWTAEMDSWEISGGNSLRGFALEITLAE